MNWIIVAGVITVITVVAIVGQRKGWVDFSWNQRRRGGSMTIADEAFNPTRYEAQVEMDRQSILPEYWLRWAPPLVRVSPTVQMRDSYRSAPPPA
ncbi:hypothetical protein E3O55_08000 [Cryobacterium sp. MDB1-18-2]|uniref:hypothetical protein n=1 Tax=unclassified Cryobacterium TaxID=2649013 RepID=UPI00106BEDB3|nr:MULTISPECIES: hypothetical protein [unclassified Cryobacterium]TFC30025.1 hypothetical protein E3O55_08000 [Cryobacterium sp. MDB1-18-2]TFC41305.1 hypothetical protein E3O50_09440 [Cryobacterium sp. MDB1-18-1]